MQNTAISKRRRCCRRCQLASPLAALVAVRGSRWQVRRVRRSCGLPANCTCARLTASRGVLLWPFDRPTADGTRRKLRVTGLGVWARRAGATPARERSTRVYAARRVSRATCCRINSRPPSRSPLAYHACCSPTKSAWARPSRPDGSSPTSSRANPARARSSPSRRGCANSGLAELPAIFSLDAARVDAAWLRAAVADRPADVSPWAAPGDLPRVD